ncbi:MAG: hypothetical protein AN484_25940, partial [Aphanizomenon flos-aquae WA102]
MANEQGDGNKYYLTSGSNPNTFSTYSIQETSVQVFKAKFDVEVEFPSANLSGSFTFNINKVGSGPLTNGSQTLPVASGYSTTKFTSYKYFQKSPSYDDPEISLLQDLTVYNANGQYLTT